MTFWSAAVFIRRGDVVGQRGIGARTLGRRAVVASVALVLGVCGMTACRTNVGNAATIDGHRVSETTVGNYVTESAEPIKSTDGSQSIEPKPFVLDVLIEQRLYPKLLIAAKVGSPGKGQLSTLRRQYLAGKTAKATVEKLGAKGYTRAFDEVIVEVQVYATLLNQAQSAGTDLNTVAAKLTFPVSVNPRYGTWDRKNLQVSSGRTSGLPGFLKLQSAPTAQS